MVINIIRGISVEMATLAICMHYIFDEACRNSGKENDGTVPEDSALAGDVRCGASIVL